MEYSKPTLAYAPFSSAIPKDKDRDKGKNKDKDKNKEKEDKVF
ncbi:hypothetical protein ID0462_11220 [Helicobacter pylori]